MMTFWLVRIYIFCAAVMPVGASAGAVAGPIGGTVSGILGHKAIDHVIPSKDHDLFVVLKNGLTVLVRESYDTDVVSCQVFVGAGSIHEGERMGGGLSHYLEHVVSGGSTSRYTEAQISDRLQALGGASNAYTSYDRTSYYINTTRAHYGDALELLLAFVSDCRFDENEYEREKKVILQEFQMGENDPSRQLWFSFVKAAYREHPVRYPVIGDRQVFESMDRNDLMAHYKRWYRPDNMVVAVAGHVVKEDVLRRALDLGGDQLKRVGNPPYVLPAEPSPLASKNVEKVVPMARLTQALMGFRSVSIANPDLYALDVLAVILGDGRTSRLYHRIRDEARLALSVGAWNWTPDFVEGQFVISMDLSYEKLPDAVDAVWEELEDLKKGLVKEETLRRAKNKVVADHVFGMEAVDDQAARMASDWITAGDPYFSDRYVEAVQRVTREEVRRVARTYLKKEAMTLAVVRPPAASSAQEEAVSALPDDLSKEVEKRVLSNGMTVLTKQSRMVPMVALQLVLKGGLRFEPEDKPGLCRFMAGLLTRGTKTRSKMDIARALEDVGSGIASSSGNNTITVSVSVLKEHLDVALEILADVVVNPSFPDEEIEKQREDTILAIRRLDEEWTTEIARMFKKHYYRNHPYRNDILGTEDAVRGFSRPDTENLYRALVKSNNAVLAVFGDVDPEVAVAKVEKVFKKFGPGPLQEPVISSEMENIEKNETFVSYNEKTSAAILVGFNGLAIDDPDVPVVDVLDAVISGIGYPSGWLHNALRGGEKSLVYFVHGYPVFGVDGGYFGITTQTTPENYDEVLGIILEKMARIREEEVDPETLERAKNMCITMDQLGRETMAAQASSAALHEILGLGYDRDQHYPQWIQGVTAGDLLRVARRLFSHHLVVATKPATAKPSVQ